VRIPTGATHAKEEKDFRPKSFLVRSAIEVNSRTLMIKPPQNARHVTRGWQQMTNLHRARTASKERFKSSLLQIPIFVGRAVREKQPAPRPALAKIVRQVCIKKTMQLRRMTASFAKGAVNLLM
jgi:hypothetical protein